MNEQVKLEMFTAELDSELELQYSQEGVRALLIIDKSLDPGEGDIVVAYIDGEFTLKRIHLDTTNDCLLLIPSNPVYQPIKITEENHFIIWGVVTYNIKRQRL